MLYEWTYIQRHLDALFFDQELKHGNNKIDRENRIFYVT